MVSKIDKLRDEFEDYKVSMNWILLIILLSAVLIISGFFGINYKIDELEESMPKKVCENVNHIESQDRLRCGDKKESFDMPLEDYYRLRNLNENNKIIFNDLCKISKFIYSANITIEKEVCNYE